MQQKLRKQVTPEIGRLHQIGRSCPLRNNGRIYNTIIFGTFRFLRNSPLGLFFSIDFWSSFPVGNHLINQIFFNNHFKIPKIKMKHMIRRIGKHSGSINDNQSTFFLYYFTYIVICMYITLCFNYYHINAITGGKKRNEFPSIIQLPVVFNTLLSIQNIWKKKLNVYMTWKLSFVHMA